jgi:hypothetical protein
MVNWQPLAQTSPQTQAPSQQTGVGPEQVMPQAPQLSGSVWVSVQDPGEPQQTLPPPHGVSSGAGAQRPLP